MVGVVFATPQEAQPFVEQVLQNGRPDFYDEPFLVGRDLLVAVVGAGKIRATLGTERLLRRHRVERLLHVGACATLRAALPAGTLVAASRALEGDHADLAALAYPHMPLEIPFSDLPRGVLVTHDRTMTPASEATSYWQRIADISDRVGYAVAFVAATHGVPCHVVKAVAGPLYAHEEAYSEQLRQAHTQIAAFLPEAIDMLMGAEA